MKFLAQLKIQKNNTGVSTGKKWMAPKGDIISSFSPVDGKLIGTVTGADKKSYDTAVSTAQKAFLLFVVLGSTLVGMLTFLL